MTVRVTPRAGRTIIAGVRDDVLQVKLAAAPVDGAANDVLVGLLAVAFHVPKRAIQILSGDRSRTKRVAITNASAAELEKRLETILGT